jgi:hypothetical protein
MRFPASLFLLLLAATAQAQPIVGNEVVWRTTPPAATFKPAAQAARLSADGDALLVTWSEVAGGVSHVCAGRLDGTGHLLSVGVCSSGTADAVTIAPFGDRYLAAWLEPGSTTMPRPLLVTAALDRGFKVLSSRVIGSTDGAPIVRCQRSRAFVGSGTSLYELDADGAAVNTYPAGGVIDDVGAAGEQVGYVVHQVTHFPAFCYGLISCNPAFDRYALTFTWVFTLTNGITYDSPSSNALPGVGANGAGFLVAWFEPIRMVKAAFFQSTFDTLLVGSRGPDTLDPNVQPQVAWDGARWLVVWSIGDGIEGSAVSPDRTVTTFTISAHGARPAVAAVTRGQFVVTYEVVDGSERRLASRVIELEPFSRGRAVR